MHLMTFIQIAQPSIFERFLKAVTQLFFIIIFFPLFTCSTRSIPHCRLFGVGGGIQLHSIFGKICSGKVENVFAPEIAKKYWNLPADARLREVVMVIREDETGHRDENHDFANKIATGSQT